MSTIVMMWNPKISSFKMDEFREILHADHLDFNWSLRDYDQVHEYDNFLLVRVGDGGNTGIVMAGFVLSEPFRAEDWSGRGRVTYYVDLLVTHVIDSDHQPYLDTATLMKELPGFDWTGGHSGRMLPDELEPKLACLWHEYLANNTDAYHLINKDDIEYCGAPFEEEYEDYLSEQEYNDTSQQE